MWKGQPTTRLVFLTFPALQYRPNHGSGDFLLAGRGAFKKSPPQILLRGKWLEQAGFSAGDKITVKCQQGQLIITKNELSAEYEK